MSIRSLEVPPDPCLAPHPDSAIRLASAVHRFPVPRINNGLDDLSFERAFRTTGSHPSTKALASQADEARISLSRALAGKGSNVSHQSIINAAQTYIPLIHRIMLSCKFQPEAARLDERLVFDWTSGMEKDGKAFKSEAIMYELVMTVSSLALGRYGKASEDSTSGDFASASRELKQAAGIVAHLAEDQLPQWIARGTNVEDTNLPSEVSVGVCDSFKFLFLAIGQQMAVATVLVKPGVPNYALLAKLTLAIAEYMELFSNTIRSEAQVQMPRIDQNFFSLITFQMNLQRALSNYFLARSIWADNDYGVAISFLREATSYLRTRSGSSTRGMPTIDAKSSLLPLKDDLNDLQKHMGDLLNAYQIDNSKVYFEKVPDTLPEEKKIASGIMMMKAEAYELDQDVEPAPLEVPQQRISGVGKPTTPGEDSDAALARDLQKKLNQGWLPPPLEVPQQRMSGVGKPPTPGEDSDAALARELQRKLDMGEEI